MPNRIFTPLIIHGYLTPQLPLLDSKKRLRIESLSFIHFSFLLLNIKHQGSYLYRVVKLFPHRKLFCLLLWTFCLLYS